jgi:glycosyltransferase involved in cell wall biosynthesis
MVLGGITPKYIENIAPRIWIMQHIKINPENTIFVILSFEGPDVYSQAGGLGVRVTNLAQTLARDKYSTQLFFIGDPGMPGEEKRLSGKLILHRWCQWISAYHPGGCYQGEPGKIADYVKSIPPYLIENIIQPAALQKKLVVVLAEEWQTAATIIRLHTELIQQNLRNQVVAFWNANNTYGFEHIDFKQLAHSCTITTVSRFMKHAMWPLGLDPVVIPNGIPRRLLEPVNFDLANRIRKCFQANLVLAKIARWDPDKRWNMAIEAVAGLKAKGLKVKLIARGGMEGYGNEVLQNARSLGLIVKDVYADGQSMDDFVSAIEKSAPVSDVLNLKFYCPQALLRPIYYAADAVLANSGREPFGLVGLETMAAGGVAFTGSTGEDYAVPFYNAVVLETSNPREIESFVTYLYYRPEESARLRQAGKITAAQFTWEQVMENLIQRLEFQAGVQTALTALPATSTTIPGLRLSLPETEPVISLDQQP